MDEKLRIVKPYGLVFAGGEEYYLLRPQPIVGDSWEGDNCYRFLVTSTVPFAIEQIGYKTHGVYGYARHIVTNNFTIEFRDDIEEIYIPEPDEINYKTDKKEIEEDAEKVDYPF